MGWFDEQIRQREKNDQAVLEDSFFRMASVVLDKWNEERMEDKRLIAREALDDILKYHHMQPVEIPEELQSPEEQLEYVLRPCGMMVRSVTLEDGWQHDAYGPMLGMIRESGATVALLPGMLSGYYFRDPATGKPHICYSQALYCNPAGMITSKQVPVYIDRNNENNLYVDIDRVLAEEKQYG